MTKIRITALLSVLTCLSAGAIRAQSIEGTLIQSGTGTAIEGAMVYVLDLENHSITQSLTDASGRFRFEGLESGTYRLRADRIGHASSFSDLVEVSAGTTASVQIVATVQAIQLAGIDVEGDRRCRVRPEEGLAVATVWDEARKALASAAWTSERGVYRYALTKFSRDLDRDARKVEAERIQHMNITGQRTYQSASADVLINQGFIVEDSRGNVYYGPDADVLMSDLFLDTHCFRLRRGEDENQGLIGLEFEPVDGRRLPEVRGTLWVDPDTGELRWLDYRYENDPAGVRSDRVGGHVEFAALPNGSWIIRRWWIRMPVIQMQRRFREPGMHPTIVGIREEGARVRQIDQPGTGFLVAFDNGVIEGNLLGGDQKPLANARVWIHGTERRAVTDARGRFRLSDLDAGVYGVTFSNPTLDSLGYEPVPEEVEVVVGEVSKIELVSPLPYQVIASRCPEDERPRETAVLVGWVRDERGEPVPNGQFRIGWSGFSLDTGRRPEDSADSPTQVIVRERKDGLLVTADARGFYTVCAVPTRVDLVVVGLRGEEESREVTIRVEANELFGSLDPVVPDSRVPSPPGARDATLASFPSN